MLMRPALFWDITQHCVVIVYHNYHTTPRNIPEEHRSHIQCVQYQQNSKEFSPLSQILKTNAMFQKNQLPSSGETTNPKKQLTKI
jgi:hypothetical protein